MGQKRIGLREIKKLSEGEVVWDSGVSGFGARRQRGDAVSYVLKYRTAEGRQRWYTIGRHGAPWTPDQARDEAIRLLSEVVRKTDPAAMKQSNRNASTVSELCDLYLADAQAGRLLTRLGASKKASTLATDKGRIERHIKPLLGRLPVAAVTRDDVDTFMHDVAEGKTKVTAKTARKRGLARVTGGKGAASRTVGLLGGIFTYAVRHRLRPDNPVRGITRYAGGQRRRRLSDTEYKALGAALRKAESEAVWPAAVAAITFLAVTGWRRGEALNLRWNDVDIARRTVTLPDTKTGRSVRPLSRLAVALLKRLPQSGGLVFQAVRGVGPMGGFPKLFAKVAKLGKLAPDITPHVLRHSFTSLGNDLGFSEPTIAALVGHKGHSVTSRYIHSADAVLLAAADAVAERTSALMNGVVVQIRSSKR